MNIVIVNCFDTWEHRVDLLYKVFKEEGHKVKVLASDYRHFQKVYRTDEKHGYMFFHAKPYIKNISPARILSHTKLCGEMFGYIENIIGKTNLLWVLAPPNCFVKAAVKVKKHNPSTRLVIDLIDLWPETMPIGPIKPLLAPWKGLRNDYLKYADVVVTECNLYKSVLRKVINRNTMRTIYLAREDKGYSPHLNLPEGKISLCYLGSVNNIIDIPTIVDILNWFRKENNVLIHIIGDGENKEELVNACKQERVEVADHGKVYDREIKQRIFDSCHYGLNIMKETVCVGLTMKSIDYFEFGLPIINNIQGDTWTIIEKYGCGINITNSIFFDKTPEYNLSKRTICREFFEKYLTEGVFKKRIKDIVDMFI